MAGWLHTGIVTAVTSSQQPKAATYRLDPEIDQELTEYAQRTRRSKNAALNQLLADGLYLDHLERQKAADQRGHNA